MGREGASCVSAPSQPQMPGALDQHFQIPGGGLDTVAMAALQCLLAGTGPLARTNGIKHPGGGHISLQHEIQPWPVLPFAGLQLPSN